MKLKKKTSRSIKIKANRNQRMRTKPIINTKWRTQLNFWEPDTNTKAQKIEMNGRRKIFNSIEPLPTLPNTSPQLLCHNRGHWMRRLSGFFTTLIVLMRLWNNSKDSNACMACVNIFYWFINIFIR